MPQEWLKRIKKTGQLTAFNKATAWSVPVAAAIKTFNSLGFGVTIVAEKEEKATNIVLLFANGPGENYKYHGDTATTDSDFIGDALHGQSTTFTDPKLGVIFFAAVFLPGKIKKATDGQKEMIVVHEFIHSAGLNDRDCHDSAGIMFSPMKEDGGGLIEYIPDKGVKPMPPIRVGAQTMCKMKMLWAGAKDCKDS